MNYELEYAKFNEFYFDCVDIILKNARVDPNNHYGIFMKRVVESGVDLYKVPYIKKYDDYETVETLDDRYQLLPICLVNCNIPHYFVSEGVNRALGSFRLATFNNLLFSRDEFRLRNYPDESLASHDSRLKKVCQSYIEYYKESLDEIWSEEDFYEMFSSLKYVTLKYAIDEKSKEPFVVGFFGAYVRKGAGGDALTNAELYVMPEFRGRGIAKRLVGVTFDMAKEDGIEAFDSITYRLPGMDALGFWEGIGGTVSGLIHFEGDIPEMLNKIREKDIKRV